MSTPNSKQLRLRKKNKESSKELLEPISCSPKTQLNNNKITEVSEENDHSMLYLPCTQDGGEDDVEVIWDWHSPQNSKYVRKITHKRITESKSPVIIVPIKRKQFDVRSKGINSLKAKLEALNKKIDQQSNTNLVDELLQTEVNNRLNDNTQTIEDTTIKNETVVNNSIDSLEKLLEDDSLVDVMIQCSQQVEEKFNKLSKQTNISNGPKKFVYKNLNTDNTTITKNHSATINQVTTDNVFKNERLKIETKQTSNVLIKSKCESRNEELKFDDSLDFMFGTIDDDILLSGIAEEEINKNIHKVKTNSVVVENQTLRTESNPINIITTKNCQTKTMSFDSNHSSCSPPLLCTPDEIEKKRLEAVAKREKLLQQRPKSSSTLHVSPSVDKRFQRRNISFDLDSTKSDLPISVHNEFDTKNINNIMKSMQEEIERKRQEALTKRLKKTQEAQTNVKLSNTKKEFKFVRR